MRCMAEVVTVPLFVLPMGIFPMCQEPLRVFEPRYKQMLDDCVLNNSQFGYIAANINGEDENGWTLPACLVGSEMCIRDRGKTNNGTVTTSATQGMIQS